MQSNSVLVHSSTHLVTDVSDCIFNLTRYLTLFIVTFIMAFVPDRYNGTCDTLFVISTAVNVLAIKFSYTFEYDY